MAEGKNWRKIFNFSKRDDATHQWWEAQENPSVSLQLLIREEIERNGFDDKLNAPVAQQPRRGRPRRDGEESDDEYGFDPLSSNSGSESTAYREESTPQDRVPAPVTPAPVTPTPKKAGQPAEPEQPRSDSSDEDEVAQADSILSRI